MKKLLVSVDNVGTPVQSRSAVVPENISLEQLNFQVVPDLQSPFTPKVPCLRFRALDEHVEGTLLIGKDGVSFLDSHSNVVFTHLYLCFVWYEQDENHNLWYCIKDKKQEHLYQFELDKSVSRVFDERITDALDLFNKSNGRRSGGRARTNKKSGSGKVKENISFRWFSLCEY
jgi:hypothetical protein